MVLIEPWQAILLGMGIGGFGGFVNSIIGWLGGTEPFSARKNVKSIITAVIAGIALAYGSIQAFGAATTPETLIGISIMVFISAAGVQQLAHNTSKIISKPDEQKTTTLTTTTKTDDLDECT